MKTAPLTEGETRLLRNYQDINHGILKNQGIDVSYYRGLNGWAEIMGKHQSLIDGISPAFDPGLGQVNTNNSAWLLARTSDDVMGWVAMRQDWIADYQEHVSQGRLWGPEGAKTARPLPNYIPSDLVKKISGSVVHSGGACVTLPFRKKKLAGRRLISYFTRLLRTRGLLEFDADWLTGTLVDDKLAELNFGTEVYGYETTVKISENYLPSMDSFRDVWLNVSSRHQQVAAFRQELNLIGHKVSD